MKTRDVYQVILKMSFEGFEVGLHSLRDVEWDVRLFHPWFRARQPSGISHLTPKPSSVCGQAVQSDCQCWSTQSSAVPAPGLLHSEQDVVPITH